MTGPPTPHPTPFNSGASRPTARPSPPGSTSAPCACLWRAYCATVCRRRCALLEWALIQGLAATTPACAGQGCPPGLCLRPDLQPALPSLPPWPSCLAQFLSVLMRPNPKNIVRLRKLLAQQFGHGVGSEHFSGEGDDMFPYVSFTLNIE